MGEPVPDQATGPAPEESPPEEGPSPDGTPPSLEAADPRATQPSDGGAGAVTDGGAGAPAGGYRGGLAKLAKERDEYLDQYKRTRADFENYRKRMLKQQTEQMERAAEALIEKLLPVLDNFDAAIAHRSGYEQVHTNLIGTLKREGLHRIDPAGKPFDPTEADAVAHEEGDDGPVVAEVLRPGYKWKGRVLRPAMVKVRG